MLETGILQGSFYVLNWVDIAGYRAASCGDFGPWKVYVRLMYDSTFATHALANFLKLNSAMRNYLCS